MHTNLLSAQQIDAWESGKKNKKQKTEQQHKKKPPEHLIQPSSRLKTYMHYFCLRRKIGNVVDPAQSPYVSFIAVCGCT